MVTSVQTVNARQGNLIQPVEVVILTGETVSNAAQLFGCSSIGLYLPIMTGTQLTFQVSPDNITYYDLNDPAAVSPAPITIDNNGLSAAYPLFAPYFAAWRWLKIISNIAEAADRTLLLAPYDI